jgi:hypothetical protein
MSAKLKFTALVLFISFIGLALSACGGGGSSSKPVVSVSLSPSTAQSIDQGQKIQFTASVTNDTASAGVTWTQTGQGSLSSQTTTGATFNAPTSGAAGSATVTATSVADTSKTASVNVSIALAPTISPTLAPATLGSTYNQKISVTGGTGTLTYALANNSLLPIGLTLNAGTGAITGTPTGPVGTTNFVAKVADSSTAGSVSVTQAMSLTVNSAGSLSIKTTSLPNGTLNAAYSAMLQSSGGFAPITWSLTAGTLPMGLSLNSSTGAITGTPTVPGTSTLTFLATDSSTPTPQTASATLTLTVPQLVINTTSLLNPMVGEAYNQTVQYTEIGSPSPSLTWSISAGSLPAGFSIDPTTGAITGTATSGEVGSTSFTVQLVDASTQLTATQALSLTITTATACGSGSESLLSGQYALFLSGFDAHGPVGILASFTADGTGHITAGFEDINSTAGVQSDVPVTTASSSYSVGADQRGCLTLVAGGVTRVFRFGLGLISSGVSQGGRTIEFDTISNTTGVIRVQNPPDFSNAAVQGNFTFGVSSPFAAGGLLAASGVLTLSGSAVTGSGDINNNGTLNGGSAGPITFGAGTYSIGGNGRGTLSFTAGSSTLHLIVYVLYANQFFMMSGDAQSSTNTLFSGDAQLQTGAPYSLTSLSSSSTLFASGQTSPGTPTGQVLAGIFTPDGNGNYSFSGDQSLGGTVGTVTVTGTYTVASNGRVQLISSGGTTLFYLMSPNKGFILFTDAQVLSGFAEPQSGGPFTTASLTGTYCFATTQPLVANSGLTSGVTAFTAPNANVTFDYNQAGFLSLDNQVSQTYSVSSAGRVLTPASGTTQKVSYIIFPGKVIVMDYSPTVTNPTVAVMEQ